MKIVKRACCPPWYPIVGVAAMTLILLKHSGYLHQGHFVVVPEGKSIREGVRDTQPPAAYIPTKEEHDYAAVLREVLRPGANRSEVSRVLGVSQDEEDEPQAVSEGEENNDDSQLQDDVDTSKQAEGGADEKDEESDKRDYVIHGDDGTQTQAVNQKPLNATLIKSDIQRLWAGKKITPSHAAGTGQLGVFTGAAGTGQPSLDTGAAGTGQPSLDTGAAGTGQPSLDTGAAGTGQPSLDTGAAGTGQPSLDTGAAGTGQPSQDTGATERSVDPTDRPLNVLYIVTDDMRPEIGAFIDLARKPWLNPKIQTPHLDALASRSLVLHNAYVQLPRCGPSRASLLTSRRPDTLRVFENNDWFRKIGHGKDLITLPQYFKMNNYTTMGMGKVFHLLGTEMYNQDQQHSWSNLFYQPRNNYEKVVDSSWKAVTKDELHYRQLRDHITVNYAKRRLPIYAARYKRDKKPFFMAVGIKMPHLPYVFPAEFLDMYPEEEVKYPVNDFVPHKMSRIAWHNSRNMFSFNDTEKFHATWEMNSTLPRNVTLEHRRAYYAGISYVDSLVGELVDTIESQGLKDSTIIVFHSDHGFQLGEHGVWGKDSLLDLATNAPLIIAIPGLTDTPTHSYQLTEFVDIFPTVAEAAGLPPVPLCPARGSDRTPLCTEGISLLPLVKAHNDTKWKERVFSQYPYPDAGVPEYMGYSMRTHGYRYTEWVTHNHTARHIDWSHPKEVELYDLTRDLLENTNIADDVMYKAIKEELSEKLHRGWRDAMPS